MNNRTLSGSAWMGVIGGALSLVIACAGEDPADKKGTGGAGGTTGGTGGATGGKGGATGGTGGATGGTAGGSVGGSAGAAIGGAGASAGGSAGAAAGAAGAMAGGAGETGGGMAGTAGSAGDAAGGMAGNGGMGGMVAGAGGAPVVGAMAAYHWDTASVPLAGAGGMAVDGTEGWAINSGACKANGGETSVTVTQSTEQHQAGAGSLKIMFSGIPTGMGGMGGMAGAAGAAGTGAGTAGAAGAAAGAAGAAAGAAGAGGAAPVNVDCHVKKTAAPLETGKTITYHIWIPPDAAGAVGWVKMIIEAGATYSWVSPPDVNMMPDIPLTTRSGWVMKSFTVPLSVTPPIQSIGFQFGVQNTFTGAFYIDEMTW